MSLEDVKALSTDRAEAVKQYHALKNIDVTLAESLKSEIDKKR